MDRCVYYPRQLLTRPVVVIAISYEGEAYANMLNLLGSYALMVETLASIHNY